MAMVPGWPRSPRFVLAALSLGAALAGAGILLGSGCAGRIVDTSADTGSRDSAPDFLVEVAPETMGCKVGQLDSPTFVPPYQAIDGTFQVTIDPPPNLPADGQTYYTIGGAVPTPTTGTLYTGSFDLPAAQQTTLEAIAHDPSGCSKDSAPATVVYTLGQCPPCGCQPQLEAPTFTPTPPATIAAGSEVTIHPPPGLPVGGFVFFTTDGTVPTTASNVYVGPITLSGAPGTTETLIAMASDPQAPGCGLLAKGLYTFDGPD